MSKKIFKAQNVILDGDGVFIENHGDYPNAVLPDEITQDSHDFDHVHSDETHEEDAHVEEIPNLQEIYAKANEILDSAEEEAKMIIKDAKAEAHRIVQEERAKISQEAAIAVATAEKDGFEKGHFEGYEQGVAEATDIKQNAQDLAEKTQKEREAAIAQFEPQMTEIITKVTKKIFGNMTRLNPSVILVLIRQGLAQSSFTGEVTLRVSADDYDLVMSNSEELMKFVEGGGSFDIIKDFSLNGGDCLIETPFGVVDSSLNMQMQDLLQDLTHIF